MSKLSKLLMVTDSEKEAILKHFNMTQEQFEEDVKTLKEWIKKNAHLPDYEVSGDNIYRVCLLNSKMSMERAKRSLEGYYRMRTIHADFFDKLIPNTDDFNKSKSYVQTIVMPKLAPNLCRITIYKWRDINGEAEDALIYYIITLMIAELRITSDYFLSNVIVVDMKDYGLKNMLKYSPSIHTKLINILNSVNLRVKECHVLNAPTFMDRVMLLLKSLFPAKLLAKVHIHNSYDTLYEYIPREYLPSNYGGTEKSIEGLYEDWCSELQIWEPMFKELLKVKTRDELKVETHDTEIFGMGSEGSFKKLAID